MVESLAAMLDSVAAGKYPAPDGGITIMEQAPTRYAGVIGFTAHAVIFVDADPAWVSAQLPAGDLRWPLTPRFLQALCERTGRHAHSIDLLWPPHRWPVPRRSICSRRRIRPTRE